MNPPTPLGPVVMQDRLWRSRMCGYYGQVLEKDGLLYLWTNCGWGDAADFPNAAPGKGLLYGKERYVQLLMSRDGLHWESPELHRIACGGSTANNLLFTDSMEGTFLYEAHAPEQERWKYVATLHGENTRGIGVRMSADGLHWQPYKPWVFPVFGDSQNVCYYDEVLGRYALYFRSFTGRPGTPEHGQCFAWSGEGHRERSVARVTFSSWEELGDLALPTRNVIEPDENDPEGMDIYTNAAVRYPLAKDVTLAFPSIYRKFAVTPEPYLGPGVLPHNNGILGTQLAVSRNGEHFERIRAPYMSGDPVGGIASASNYFHVGMIITGDSILQYYWGGNHTHGGDARYADPPRWHRNAVFAARQRIDGFCSMDFDPSGGMLLTEAFPLPEGALHLNVNTFAWGDLSVSLLDEQGQALPVQESTAWIGNYTDVTVLPASALSAHVGRPVRLRFEGRSAKLYSYWFA